LRVANREAGAVIQFQIDGRLVLVIEWHIRIVGGDAPVALVAGQVGVMRQNRRVVHDDVARWIGADNERFAVEGDGRFLLVRHTDDEKFGHRKKSRSGEISDFQQENMKA